MKYLSTILLLVAVVSCNLDSSTTETPAKPKDFTVQNEKDIVAYLAANDLVAEKSTTGLHYIITEPGTGEQPTTSSNVTVAYKGYYLNGSVFDESDAAGISFSLQGVIPGWTEGITYFKEGGKGMLFVPAHLAYGSFDYKGIPGGSALIFDVELISVN